MKKDAGQILISGCRGSGKTTRQRELIENKPRVIALDPMRQFTRGFTRCTNQRQVTEAVLKGWNDGFKITIPTGHDSRECATFIKHFIPLLEKIQQPYADSRRDMKGKEVVLIVDEADLFFPNKGFDADIQSHIETLTRRGRHYGIETIAATTRLANVATTYRGNCTEHYFFSQADHNDIRAVLAIIGGKHADALQKLKPHQYLHRSMTAGGVVTAGRNTANFR